MAPTTVFLVNGRRSSAAGDRATRIAAALGEDVTVVVHRGGARATDANRFVRKALGYRGGVVYAMDLAVVPVVAATIASGRNAMVVDTGDAPAAFFRQVKAGRVTIAAATALEILAYGRADQIVVRGSYHERQLRERGYERVSVVPDGVDLEVLRPVDDRELRRRLGLSGVFTVGIQGHFTWFPSLGGGLGWELLQAIALRPEVPVHAVLIGDGAGIPQLRILAARLGIADRLHVLGRVPYDELSRYLGLCDVCLLTQTDDPSSWVRTTGKLPGYLATGRYVLASRVGTAADLLPDEMLVDYHGEWDRAYPARLMTCIVRAMHDPERAGKGLRLRDLAGQFDYRRVAAMAADIVRRAAKAAS